MRGSQNHQSDSAHRKPIKICFNSGGRPCRAADRVTPGEVVPRAALHHVSRRLLPERRRRPLEHLPRHVEHAVRALAVRVLADRHRVERAAVFAVQPPGVERVTPRKIAPVGAAGRLFPLRLARQPYAAPRAIGGGIGVADQHHGMLLTARQRPPVAPQEFEDAGVAVDKPVSAPDRFADERHTVPGGGNKPRIVGVGYQMAVNAIGWQVDALAGFDLEPALPARHGAAVQGFIQPIAVFPFPGRAAHPEFPRRDGNHLRLAGLPGVAGRGQATRQYERNPRQRNSQAHGVSPSARLSVDASLRTLTVFELPISSSSRQQLVVPFPNVRKQVRHSREGGSPGFSGFMDSRLRGNDPVGMS